MKMRLTIALGASGIILFSNQIQAADSTINSLGQTNEQPAFGITITLRKRQVHSMEPFRVSFQIKNISNTSQSFSQMSCSWIDQWESNNHQIGFRGCNCIANSTRSISLKPDETFKEDLDGKGVLMQVYLPQPERIRKIFLTNSQLYLGLINRQSPMDDSWEDFTGYKNIIFFQMGFRPMDLNKQGSNLMWPVDYFGNKTYWSNLVAIKFISEISD